MGIKIVEKAKKGKVVQELEVSYCVQTISELERDLCEELLRHDNNEWVFDKPITANVYIDYPLSVVAEFEVKDVETIGGLLWLIAKVYKEIYDEEGTPEEFYSNLMNRTETNGKYGVYGHFLEELIFETVEIHDNNTIHLHIGS